MSSVWQALFSGLSQMKHSSNRYHLFLSNQCSIKWMFHFKFHSTKWQCLSKCEMRYKIFQLSLYSLTLTNIMQLIYSGKSCLLQAACAFHQAMKPLDCKAAAENKALKLNCWNISQQIFFLVTAHWNEISYCTSGFLFIISSQVSLR